MISFDNVSHNFAEITALKEINLQISTPALLAVTGPNGGGKSTFLKLLAGLYWPAQGKITISQQAQRIAFLPQRNEIDRTFPIRVFDVAAMGLWHHLGMMRTLSRVEGSQVEEALGQVGLKNLSDRSVYALSGGQFQRLLFARLILQDADVILLDEPFAAVDRFTTLDLMALIHKWREQGKTILAVIHDLELVRQYFPMTLLLAQRLVAFGKPEIILTQESLTKIFFHD